MEQLKNKVLLLLKDVFEPDARIEFIDERGDGRHWFLKVISKDFIGMSRLERGRRIYSALDDLIKKDYIHALRMELKEPAND